MPRGIYLYTQVRNVFNEKNMWSPSEISKKLQVSRSTVHRHLNKLVEKGYVGRYDNGPLTVYCRMPYKLFAPEAYIEVTDDHFRL